MNGAGVTFESFSNKNKLLEAVSCVKTMILLLVPEKKNNNTFLQLPDAGEEFSSLCPCAAAVLIKPRSSDSDF